MPTNSAGDAKIGGLYWVRCCTGGWYEKLLARYCLDPEPLLKPSVFLLQLSYSAEHLRAHISPTDITPPNTILIM